MSSEFLELYLKPIIWTVVTLIILIIFRLILKSSARRIAKKTNKNEGRTRQMAKYINVLVSFIAVFALLLIWGVDYQNIALIFSSVFAVIGIGLFAIWSILSNITSGILMFFYFPFNIGDKIKIHDKDFPIEAVIEDIKAFQLHLRTSENELITYPNNLILQKPISLIEKDVIN